MEYKLRHQLPLFLLTLILVLAFDSMWGYIFRNGYYDDLVYLRDVGPHLLPGSNTPLQEHYIGINLIDYWLTVLQATFANFLDGTAPSFSIYAFHFAGQLVPVIVVMYIESWREGNRNNFTSLFSLWAVSMQSVGYGIVMPIWCIGHLATSKAAQDNSLPLVTLIKPRDSYTLLTLPVTIILSYIVPAVAMSLPLNSLTVHQYFVAVWQMFPIWLLALQYCFGKTLGYFQDRRQTTSDTKQLHIADDKALFDCYRFAFALTTGTHLLSLGLIAFISWSPPVTLSSVFVPPFFRISPVVDMVQGAQAFFQYDQYVGSMAALVWALSLYNDSRENPMTLTQFSQVLVKLVGYTMVAGPSGVVAMIMWTRDDVVLRNGTQEAKVKEY